MLFALLMIALMTSACAHSDAVRKETPDASLVPSWLQRSGPETPRLIRDRQLDEAASLLCSAEGTRLDHQTRHLLELSVGQLETAVFLGTSAQQAQTKARGAAPALLDAHRTTHVGLAEGMVAGQQWCLAIVGARRLLRLTAPLPVQVGSEEAFPLEGELLGSPDGELVLFAIRPGGSVSRTPLAVTNGYFSQLITPRRGAGRYTLELMLNRGHDPEVALLWPFRVGEERSAGALPPHPAVLFDDDGHDDVALSHRAEALVQRLRTEQEINVLKVAPPLLRVADFRAEALLNAAGLGHQRPAGRTPLEDLQHREPRFEVVRIAEVQAQASTLKDAWLALLTSPSHRYQLVHPSSTHFGAIVRSGQDGAGRRLVTLEILLARRFGKRLLKRYQGQVLQHINGSREQKGLHALVMDRTLTQICTRQAHAMAEKGVPTDGGLGEPVAQLARAMSSYDEVRAELSVLQNPGRFAPTSPMLTPAMNATGIALVPEREGSGFMLCVLVGQGDPNAS